MTPIYKIFRPEEWAELEARGTTRGAPIDVADGYVHFSAPDQVRETAAKHFAGASGLILATLDADMLGAALKWEPSRGGALFPHLYRALDRDDVIEAHPVPMVDGRHDFDGLVP